MGPLKDIKVIEMAGIGPAPFCGMILADMGAEVISVERITAAGRGSSADIASRGKKLRWRYTSRRLICTCKFLEDNVVHYLELPKK